MSMISKAKIAEIAESVTSQLALIETLRFDVTERQADSHNHLEQDALQEQLDHLTTVAANLNQALKELAT